MSDFRKSFYDRYVSTFKKEGSQLGVESLSDLFTWYDYKFAPLLRGISTDRPILELGCGPGYLLEWLSAHNYTRVNGIDISQEQVQQAKARGCTAEVADVTEYLRNKEGTFEVIFAIDFIEHFHRDELLQLVPLIFRSLRNGGKFILQTPNGEGLFSHQVIYGDLTHSTIFSASSLQQLLSPAGFQNFSFYETDPVPKNIVNRLRIILWICIKFLANGIRKIETGKTQAIWTENIICCCEKGKT